MPTVLEVARWAITALVLLVLIVASISDVMARRIPNWTIAAIVILFVGWASIMPSVSLLSSLEAAAIIFVVTIAVYAFDIVGAGDSKLMTALALFVGLNQLPLYVFVTALAGGVIAVISLIARPTRTLVMYQMRFRGDFGRGIPYGVAISLAGGLILVHASACVSSSFLKSVCFTPWV